MTKPLANPNRPVLYSPSNEGPPYQTLQGLTESMVYKIVDKINCFYFKKNKNFVDKNDDSA
ncbi:MAG TPA: hypothetical protein VKA95_10570 [Nitrososphaeraceae archaeon]|nr:hypothetical protein [Nitrososphaeraceae archaeon]